MRLSERDRISEGAGGRSESPPRGDHKRRSVRPRSSPDGVGGARRAPEPRGRGPGDAEVRLPEAEGLTGAPVPERSGESVAGRRSVYGSAPGADGHAETAGDRPEAERFVPRGRRSPEGRASVPKGIARETRQRLPGGRGSPPQRTFLSAAEGLSEAERKRHRSPAASRLRLAVSGGERLRGRAAGDAGVETETDPKRSDSFPGGRRSPEGPARVPKEIAPVRRSLSGEAGGIPAPQRYKRRSVRTRSSPEGVGGAQRARSPEGEVRETPKCVSRKRKD